MASTTKYTSQAWSCKDFDEQECQQQILQNLQEQYNTIFDCMFLPQQAAGGQEGLLLATYNSGDVRLFNWRHVCGKWLASRAQQFEQLSWQAHNGPAYAIALLQFQEMHMIATAGGDGAVRLWRLADILEAAAAAAAAAEAAAAAAAEDEAVASSCQPQAAAEVQLPHVQNPLGLSDGRQPAALTLAVDQQHQQLFVGASDGGVHAWRLTELSAVAAALGSCHPSAAAAAASMALTPMAGHAAAVLGLDHCPATNRLASASEDGTVRVWDCSSCQCLSIINPWEEQVIPLDQPLELLKCAKSPGCVCVRFDSGGNWMLVGNSAGFLTLWNCTLNTAVRHKECKRGGSKVIPQVLVVTPSAIYMAGTDNQLYRCSFHLEQTHAFEVGAESVFGVAVEPSSSMLAVCGSRGCLDFITPEGACSGLVRPPASVLLPLQSKQIAG